ncbi:MAG: hypothetical protein KKD38_09455 [Candidatus Delongbacteria bacterium]|nr:hypothetical protein [Candidatus Delongbacteria bacterium]MCG2761069.1 hypothetical protein [Candidatus Delongbacteria bacterium]
MRIIFLFLFVIALNAFTQESKAIEGEYTYQYSDNETIVQARDVVRRLALADAVGKFATYIESRIVVENYVTQKDEIVATSMGFVQNVKILEQVEDRNLSQIYMKVSCELNEEKVMNSLIKRSVSDDEGQKKIGDFIYLAIAADKENRIADALKYYYWALVLFNNNKNKKSITIPEFNDLSITVAVPDRINRILTELNFSVLDIDENETGKTITVQIEKDDRVIDNLDFKYFQIDDWSPMVSSKNGIATIELTELEKQQTKISILIEYAYADRANFDQELADYLASSNIKFEKSSFVFDTAKKLKNNLSEINKLGVTDGTNGDDLSLGLKPEDKKSKKWWYIGGGSAVAVGILIAVLMNGDDVPADTSTNVNFNIPVPVE